MSATSVFFLFQICVSSLNQKLVEMFMLETRAVLVLLFCLDKENIDRVHLLVGIIYVKFLDASNQLVWLKSLFAS